MIDLLTISLPVYKRTEYFRLAIESAINQTVKCRILVVDNNSPHDDFKKIVDSYNNPLIEYIKTSETVPQDENFNNCIRFTKTPWITILHDDDYLHCQFVELAQKILGKYKDTIGGFSVRNHVDSQEWPDVNTKVNLAEDFLVVKPTYFYFKQLTPFPGVVFNRELGLKLNGYNVSLHPIADLDFWRRLSENSTMLYVSQTLAYYRISPNQSTNRLIDDMINNVYRYRLNLIRERKVKNNFLTRLGVEYVRITGIQFFQNQYPHIRITSDYPNYGCLKFTRFLMKLPLFSRFMDWYVNKLCFGPALPSIKSR
jgi:glycosyltransferase involved in cell wall biosynthesis